MDVLEGEERPQLTESEIKTVKKELRALQKQAEGKFSLRCGRGYVLRGHLDDLIR